MCCESMDKGGGWQYLTGLDKAHLEGTKRDGAGWKRAGSKGTAWRRTGRDRTLHDGTGNDGTGYHEVSWVKT